MSPLPHLLCASAGQPAKALSTTSACSARHAPRLHRGKASMGAAHSAAGGRAGRERKRKGAEGTEGRRAAKAANSVGRRNDIKSVKPRISRRARAQTHHLQPPDIPKTLRTGACNTTGTLHPPALSLCATIYRRSLFSIIISASGIWTTLASAASGANALGAFSPGAPPSAANAVRRMRRAPICASHRHGLITAHRRKSKTHIAGIRGVLPPGLIDKRIDISA